MNEIAIPTLFGAAGWISWGESLFAWLVFVTIPAGSIALLTFLFLGLPRLRAERARFFLDLLSEALRKGKSCEAALVSISRSGESSLGSQFHLLACHLESGVPLIQALERVPRFLPPQVAGMLSAGMRANALARMIPACRKTVADSKSTTRAGLNYHLVLLFLLNPVFYVVTMLSMNKVFPVYAEVAQGYGLNVRESLRLGSQILVICSAIGIVAMLVCVGFWTLHFMGPSFARWIESGLWPVGDWVAYATPWRRLRMQRDFLCSLAALLEAGVHEAEAVVLAAGATGNAVFRIRAGKVVRELEDGLPLQLALKFFDPRGEIEWRFETAFHELRGFSQAVEAYGEVLDSRAYRLEQFSSQVLSTGLLFLNGLAAFVLFGTMFSILSRIGMVVGKGVVR